MNIGYLGKNKQVLQWFKEIEEIKEVTVFTSVDELKASKIEHFYLEKEEYQSLDFFNIREKKPHAELLLLIEEGDDFGRNICVTHDITPIENTMEEANFKKLIRLKWFGKGDASLYKNVIAISGTHRGAGTTQISFALAQSLFELNTKSLVIGCNPYNPGEVPNVPMQHSLDTVYQYLENGVINDFEGIKKYFSEVGNFTYLMGNRNYYMAPEIKREPILKLIEIVKPHFDHIILDVGSFYDNYMPITALQCSDTHFLVATQEDVSTKEYIRWKEQVLDAFDFNPTHQYLVVNKFKNESVKTLKQIEEQLQSTPLSVIPYFPDAFDTEIENGFLYNAGYKAFNRGIIGIARLMVNNLIDVPKESKKRFQLFSKK